MKIEPWFAYLLLTLATSSILAVAQGFFRKAGERLWELAVNRKYAAWSTTCLLAGYVIVMMTYHQLNSITESLLIDALKEAMLAVFLYTTLLAISVMCLIQANILANHDASAAPAKRRPKSR